MVKGSARQTMAIDRKHAASLLFPIVAFLRIAGLSKREAEEALSLAFNRALNSSNARCFERIGHPTRYADIIAHWSRDKRYVDTTGRPRPLNMHGKNGFEALVQEISPESDASKILAIFTRLGNVRRVKKDKCKLVTPFFHTRTSQRMAFEPSAYFLADASTTLTSILTRTKQSKSPDVFWRKAENATLSAAAAKRFDIFSRERTLTFLEEIDDWLQAHSDVRHKNAKNRYRRVGLGVFSVNSKPDPYPTR